MRGVHWICLLLGFGAGVLLAPMVMGMFGRRNGG